MSKESMYKEKEPNKWLHAAVLGAVAFIGLVGFGE